jgi:sugar lactone lactonase YvrE
MMKHQTTFMLVLILITAQIVACSRPEVTPTAAKTLSTTGKTAAPETANPSATSQVENTATLEPTIPAITPTQPPDPREYVVGMGLEQDILWIITPERVIRYDMATGISTIFGQNAQNPIGRGSPGQFPFVTDWAGRAWFGGVGLSVYAGNTWKFYSIEDGLAGMVVNDIEIDNTGIIWIATDSGVNSFNGSSWKTYGIDDGLTDNYVWDIAIDPAGNKWFGTDTGISRFNGAAWESWTFEAGTFPIGAPVYSIGFDDKGNVFAATDILIAIFDGSVWSFAYPKGWDVWCHLQLDNLVFAFDKRGGLWSGSEKNGLRIYDGTSVTTYTTANGLANNEITGIIFDLAGNAWITTGYGISKFDGENWTNYIIYRDATEVSVQTPVAAPSSPVAIGTEPSAPVCNDRWSVLEPGVEAIVVADQPLEVFSKPEKSALQSYLGQISPNTIVKILKGPVGVRSGELYWKVESQAIPGGAGWVSEGYIYSEHWLELYTVPTPACGVGWTRLKVGDRAVVTPGDQNRVRSVPQKGDNGIGSLPVGSVMTILEGPVCADGLIFWKVSNASIPGGSGWTAEGDGKEYWLEPYNP